MVGQNGAREKGQDIIKGEVQIHGGLNLDDDEADAMKLSPKFTFYNKICFDDILMQKQVCDTK